MLGYLTPEETKAVLDYKQSLSQKLGPELIKIGLYGSKARGDFNHDSDIDLLVVVKKKNSLVKQVIYDALLDINFIYNVYNISVHIYTENEYNNLAIYPLSIPFWENYQRDEVQI
ncbi:MAG TPA: nucleotidyltransferase domain-containing protein [Bacillota bacterium]|nr:nucleotidyltransferase domain-containing protein [Bacillota bacterium]